MLEKIPKPVKTKISIIIPINQHIPPRTKPIIFKVLAVFALDRPPLISPKSYRSLAWQEHIIAGIPSQKKQNKVFIIEQHK